MSCPTGKIRYRDKVGAMIALSSAVAKAERGHQKRAEQRVYPCGFCRGWHLTSQWAGRA